MSIKENTIVSTTDTKVTLLQWLKMLDKNVNELKEKGVDMHLLVFNSAQEFYEYFKKLGNGTSSFTPFLIKTDELYICAFGESLLDDGGTTESPEGNMIYVYGMIGRIDALSDEGRFAMGGTIYLAEVDGKAVIDSVDPNDYWYVNEYQLNKAIESATQKTYWHTIKLHNSSLEDVQITIVIPSHSNTPVVDQQGFIAIGAGDTWGCSGTMALTNDSLEFVTFDNVKFGTNFTNTIFSGTLGMTFTLNDLLLKGISFTDNVKEVK